MEPKAEHADCNNCPLQFKKFVPSSVPKNGTGRGVALVSRSPGYYDKTGPFTGPSGKVVDYLLGKYGYSRDEILLTNVVLCETDAPPIKAIACCRPRLLSELQGSKTIIAAGSEAVAALTEHRSVHSARGYVHESKTTGQRIVPANNPALVMRESDVFPTLVTDFRMALDPMPEPTFPEVEIINDPNLAKDRLQEWIATEHTITATDLEWSELDIYCAGFSFDGKRAVTYGRRVIQDPECFGLIKRFYESDKVRTCWHNGKSDTTVLWRNGIRGRVDHDTFLLSYVLDEEPGRHSLDYLLQTEFGWPNYTPASVEHFKKTGKLDYYGTDEESMHKAEYELYEYNGWDTAGTYQLYDTLSKRAKSEDVYERPYLSILLPAADAFRTMELHGFRFDTQRSADIMESHILPRLKELTEQMREISGQGLLSPRSPKQMAALYYDIFGLQHNLKDKQKQKFSRGTGKEVREEIEGGRFTCKPQHKQSLIKFSGFHQSFAKIERQRANYFQSLIERVDAHGYIHPWFNLGGTTTGRTSSTEPNFQNITREGVEGIPSIRELFLPSEGNVLISADFSQAELRSCAVLSQDPKLLAIYTDNTRSLHKERAAAFYGENYTYEEYVKSKNINFGVTYGQSAMAFAQMYHMPEHEAQEYIDSWWRQFPVLKQWVESVQRQALDGVVVSPLGYKRRFHLITKDNVQNIQREAVNFVPQNTAGGLTISAVTELINTHGFIWYINQLEMDNMPIVNSVHDSIVCDCPRGDSIKTAKIMKQVMESRAKELLDWDLPFTVDVSIGDTWATVKEVEL